MLKMKVNGTTNADITNVLIMYGEDDKKVTLDCSYRSSEYSPISQELVDLLFVENGIISISIYDGEKGIFTSTDFSQLISANSMYNEGEQDWQINYQFI